MFKSKNKPRIKTKVMEVKSKALIGKSQMEKVTEKLTSEGWELVSKRKVKNKDRYTLEFKYEMSQEEIARANRNKLIRNGIIGFLVFACCGISYFQGAAINRENDASTSTAVAIAGTEDAHATQTATLWTPTHTFTPSMTPSITPSPTITDTPAPTNTITATPSATITDTPAPTNTSPPTQVITTTYYVQTEANIRDCPQLDCDLVTTYYAGTPLQVTDTNVPGDEWRDSTRWMAVSINGEIAYVHSALISTSQPAPTAVPQSNTSSTTGDTNAQSVAPAQPAGSNCTCSFDAYNCTDGSFSSRAEAQTCFDKCNAEGRGDIHGLDGNNDGNICESGVH